MAFLIDSFKNSGDSIISAATEFRLSLICLVLAVVTYGLYQLALRKKSIDSTSNSAVRKIYDTGAIVSRDLRQKIQKDLMKEQYNR